VRSRIGGARKGRNIGEALAARDLRVVGDDSHRGEALEPRRKNKPALRHFRDEIAQSGHRLKTPFL
jgi:hypothetical protein